VRSPARRADDADVIRARLRALLADVGVDRDGPTEGWLPDDDPDSWPVLPDEPDPGVADEAGAGTGLPPGIGRHRSPSRTARWDPGRPGARSLWIAGLAAAALLVGWTWVDRPRVEPAPARSATTGAEVTSEPSAAPPVGEAAGTSEVVVVSVVGLVARPGLVSVPAGARVADAITAAGGLLPEADPASVNLAAVLTDGQQISIGVPGVDGAASPPEVAGEGLVDLNTATVAELDGLPGIGPVLADRIVAHRDEQGPFRSVEELEDVPGIGPAVFAELSGRVTV
jgi:competence protein ComEA